MANVLREIREKYENSTDFGINQILRKKKKLLLWVVSNCGGWMPGATERMKISDLLKNTAVGGKFDREGSCFSKKRFPMERFKEYKFYLAMENSYHCKDYITEKLYRNGFLVDTVPIVWGAKKSDYNFPKNSVIFMEDYDTMDDLAGHLDYLDKNDTAYLEYFKWRKADLSSASINQHGLCGLCSAIQENKLKNKIVKSVYSWIYEDENPECLKFSK